jgi:hypothetical protein
LDPASAILLLHVGSIRGAKYGIESRQKSSQGRERGYFLGRRAAEESFTRSSIAHEMSPHRSLVQRGHNKDSRIAAPDSLGP